MRFLATPLLAVAVLLLAATDTNAQTSPEPYALSQGDYVLSGWPASSPAGTYPAHMSFHRGPRQDPGLEDEPNADYTDAYNLTSGPRITGLGADGFSFVNTGSNGNLGAAVLALNTTGIENVRVAWTGGTVAAAPREYAIRLQYRVGESGAFTDVPGPVEYVAGATGESEALAAALPAEAAGQPVVHVRWKYYSIGGTGARPQLRVGDIVVSASDAAASGTGTATFGEDNILRGGQAQTFELVVAARSNDEGDRLTHVDFTLPEGFGAVTPAQVELIPTGGSVSVEGRTVRISGAEISLAEPLRIRLRDVEVPDVSGVFGFGVRTGAGSDQTVALAEQPVLRVWGTPEPIAQVAANDTRGVSTRIGDWVTVRGIVTASDQFRTGGGEPGPSYLEDASGGMAVFAPRTVSDRVNVGDEVILLGRVTQFFGQNQLDESTTIIETISTGNVVEPEVVTLNQISRDGQGGVEVYEGRLVRINNVTVNTTFWNVEGSGTNYTLSDASGTLEVRVNPGVDFAGEAAPGGTFDIVGLVSQFSFAEPHIGGYQLLPRSSQDILDDSDAPAIVTRAPFETAATPGSVTLSWSTDRPAHTEVRYVTPDGETGRAVDETPKTEHTITVSGLSPASIYTLELRSASGTDTTRIGGYPVSTTAPEGATGAIDVYFNKSVDTSLALETEARVRSPLAALLERIDAAQHSIDIALYSLSGDAGMQVANALIAAHGRGVRVRFLMDQSTSQTAPPRALRDAGVPFITDTFGANTGEGLHHNKFGVFDLEGGAPDEVWVFNGSWNPSDPGTNVHHQNVVFIQDGAVAGAYAREFEQMWGSTTATPNAAQSRFGARKELVAPTVFWVGDVYTRLFFSPQGFGAHGSTEQQIIGALATADHEIYLGLNLITRQSLVDAMRERHDAGVAVRGVIGEISTTGSVFAPLAAWADVIEFSQSQFGLLHHKYALVDAEHPESNPITITGSHNWSASANQRNDENTLIFHSADITNQYLQEFAARYRQAGGAAPVSTEDEAFADVFSLSGNYPNPFTTSTTFEYHLAAPSTVTVTVYDLLGREVARVVDAAQPAGTHRVSFDASRLSSGVYLYRLEAAGGGQTFHETRRMVLTR